MITEIKWLDTYIAVGSHDCKVYIYSVASNTESSKLQISLLHSISQHYSSITHIDFSVDAKYLRVSCLYNLNFFSTENGSHIQNVSILKDVKWKTNNVPFSWHVQGIWSSTDMGSQVECIDCYIDEENEINSVIVGGNNDGKLVLFHFPCISHNPVCTTLSSHHGKISRVGFVSKGKKIISLGFNDNSIMVWKAHEECCNVDRSRNAEQNCDVIIDDTYDDTCSDEIVSNQWKTNQHKRPWISSAISPTNINSSCISLEMPNFNLSLERMNGFYGEFLYGISTFDVVTNCGSAGIIVDTLRSNQSYFMEHEGTISAMAMARRRQIIASGDNYSVPSIRVWDINTSKEIVCLQSLHRGSIKCLSFAADDRCLISIGSEHEHCICLWRSLSGEWFDATLQAKTQYGTAIPIFLSVFDDSNCFVTGDNYCITFWDHKVNDNTMVPINGTILNNDVVTFAPCYVVHHSVQCLCLEVIVVIYMSGVRTRVSHRLRLPMNSQYHVFSVSTMVLYLGLVGAL